MSANMKLIENNRVNEDKTLKKAIKLCGNFYGLDCKITRAFNPKDTNIWIVTGVRGYSKYRDWTINADVYDSDEYKTVQQLLENIHNELNDEYYDDEGLESFITSIFYRHTSEIEYCEAKNDVYSKLHNQDSDRIRNEQDDNEYWADVGGAIAHAIRITMATWYLNQGRTDEEIKDNLKSFFSFGRRS